MTNFTTTRIAVDTIEIKTRFQNPDFMDLNIATLRDMVEVMQGTDLPYLHTKPYGAQPFSGGTVHVTNYGEHFQVAQKQLVGAVQYMNFREDDIAELATFVDSL